MCPGCRREDDPEGFGVLDAGGRKWCNDCARKRLARNNPEMIGCCPGCGEVIGDGVPIQDARRRRWHFTNDGADCVGRFLATL